MISEFSSEYSVTVISGRDTNVTTGSLWGEKTTKPASGAATNEMDSLRPRQMWPLGNKEGQRRCVAFVQYEKRKRHQVARNSPYMI